MPVVTDTVLDPGSVPIRRDDGTAAGVTIEVRARGNAENPNVPVYTTTGTIIGPTTVTAGIDGTWSLTLPGNSVLNPPDSWYDVTYRFEDGTVFGPVEIVVPPTGGPYQLQNLLRTPPATYTEETNPTVLGAFGGTRVYIPPGFGSWRSRRDRDGRRHILCYGDSLIFGLYAWVPWVERLAAALNNGPASLGFRGLQHPEWSWSGTWTYPSAPPAGLQFDRAPHIFDIGAGDYRPLIRYSTSNQAHIATYTRNATGDLAHGVVPHPQIAAFDVFTGDAFAAAAGEYSIDGGAWTAIPTAASGAYAHNASTSAFAWRRHRIVGTITSTIRFRGPTTGAFYLLGGTPYATATGGTVVHNLGRSGAGIRDTIAPVTSPAGDRWAFLGGAPTAGDTMIPDGLGGLFITDMLFADAMQAGSIDTYAANLTALIHRAQAANLDVLIVGPMDTSDAVKAFFGIATGALDAFRDRARAIARAEGCAFISIADQWGPEAGVHDTFMQSPYTDGLHPGQTGHDDWARRVARLLENGS
jgi:hypothetical protein